MNHNQPTAFDEFDVPDEECGIPAPSGPPIVFTPDSNGLVRISPKRPSIPNSVWPPELVFDLALGVDSTTDIMERHQLTDKALGKLWDNQMFRADVAGLRMELHRDGATLRTKARLQAEGYLQILDDMIHDVSITASAKLACIQQVCKLGDVEPKKDTSGVLAGEGFSLQINIQNN